MSETISAEKWLYSMLSSDEQLAELIGTRIYAYLAPANTQYPLAMFAFENGEDEPSVGGGRLNTLLRYSVKAVGETSSFAALEPIANRIDAILHGAASGLISECIRVEPLAQVEITEAGEQYRHLGGVYQLRVMGA